MRNDTARLPRRFHAAGFTLVEVMIALVIIAILASVAVPGYLKFTREGKRSEARAMLMERVQRMERFKFDKGSYVLTADEKKSINGWSEKRNYKIDHWTIDSGLGFRLRARAQFSDPQCWQMFIDNLGRRGYREEGKSTIWEPGPCW